MNKLFNIDSPIIAFLGRLTDLIILSLLWLLCSIPIITVGPATSALYYVTLKMVRQEDSSIIKHFFHAFKDNFCQGLIYSVILLVGCLIIVFDLQFMASLAGPLGSILKIVIFLLLVCFLTIMFYVFPLQAQFSNTIRGTIKNAILFSRGNLITSFIVFVVNMSPVLIAIISVEFLLKTLLLWLFFAPAVISYLCALLFAKIFDPFLQSVDSTA